MSSKEISIDIEGDVCVVASVEAACVAAFYATSDAERHDMHTPFLHLLASFMRLEGLGRCETIEEVKELLGEALLWMFFIHFVHVQEGSRTINCKWFKSHEWSTRGPDRSLSDWRSIMGGLREKGARFAGVLARYAVTSPKARTMTSATTLVPAASDIVHDRVNGEDLRSLCDMYKLSPRECFEAAILKRRHVLESTHKKLSDKKARR